MRSLGWPSAYVSRQSIVRRRISSRRAPDHRTRSAAFW